MSRADKQALAKLLEQIATELELAEQRAEALATSHGLVGGNRDAYMRGALEHAAKSAGHGLRVAIRSYLEPKTSKEAA